MWGGMGVQFEYAYPTYGGFPGGSAGKESACNAGDLGSIPWIGKIPWRKEQLPTPVFWPGEFHGLFNESDMTEQLSYPTYRI